MNKAISNAVNAQKSTGPVTPAGRLTSSRNSTRHGVFALSPTIRGERLDDWEAFLAGIMESLAPAGALEEVLSTRIALALWRHRRLIRWEADAVQLFEKKLRPPGGPFELEMSRMPDARALDCIARYESHLGRQFRADLHELQRSQAARSGQLLAPPLAVDIALPAGRDERD